jgi:cardiolipin synthase (CMP-forming)
VDPGSSKSKRVFTIPNVISAGRLLCVPLFVWLLKDAHAQRAAAALLAVLGATDWVDGWIARRYDQGSDLGKILDPTADRVLLLAGAIALLGEGLPVGVDIVLWIILVREILIALTTIVLGLAGAKRIDVVWAGKAGTLALMFALPMFLLADIDGPFQWLFALCGWGFAIAGIVLGYYAAARYVPAAREALREGRAARVAAEVRG